VEDQFIHGRLTVKIITDSLEMLTTPISAKSSDNQRLSSYADGVKVHMAPDISIMRTLNDSGCNPTAMRGLRHLLLFFVRHGPAQVKTRKPNPGPYKA
jgi:hypothetical protein